MTKWIEARHFLRADLTAGSGNEPAWTVGETRKYDGKVVICETGYHSSPSWFDALQYAPGPVACIVEVSRPIAANYTDKQVSRQRRLIRYINVERELRLFACDCAERALTREREAGREPDPRSLDAIEVDRRYANGQASVSELAAAAWAAK